MEYQIDLNRFCREIRSDRKDNLLDEIYETSGEKYLEKMLQKFAVGIPVRICEIDFSAFDEDDIVDLIDNKGREIDDLFCAFERIAEGFINCKPMAAKTKRFF